MKNIWTALALLLSGTIQAPAQTLAYNFPGDFDAHTSCFTRHADGLFLIGGLSGATGECRSKGFLMGWREDGEGNGIEWLQTIQSPDGGAAVLATSVLDDGNIIAAGWTHLAGSAQPALFVAAYSAAGNPLWMKQIDTLASAPSWLRLAKRSGDQIVLLRKSNSGPGDNLLILSATDGSPVYSRYISVAEDVAVHPLTQEIVVVGGNELLRFHPENGTNSEQNPVPDLKRVRINSTGNIYTMNEAGTISRFSPTGTVSHIGTGMWYSSDFVLHNDGPVIGKSTGVNPPQQNTVFTIRLFNDSLVQQGEPVIIPFNTQFSPSLLAFNDNRIFLAGYEQHGPDACFYQATGYLASTNPVVRVFSFDGTPQSPAVYDAEIESVDVVEPPFFEETSPPPGASSPYWNITGGVFRFTIKNQGTTTLHSVNLLGGRLGNYHFYCDVDMPFYSERLDDLALEPGESMVVDVAIQVENIQSTWVMPWQPRFWVAAPNDQADYDWTNDYVELVFWDLVPTRTPGDPAQSIRAFPNPADDEIRVVLPGPAGNSEASGRIFNVAGQLVQSFVVPAGTREFSEPVADWPARYYLIEYRGARGKFVKR